MKVIREEALLCRLRYFTDGGVLGSKEFVQEYFETHRKAFGERRRDGRAGKSWHPGREPLRCRKW